MKTQRLPKEYLKQVGHRIKIVRTYLNMDQKQLSERINTAQSQVSKIEIGRSAPTLYQLLIIKQLAEENAYLRENLTWEWLLEGKGRAMIG